MREERSGVREERSDMRSETAWGRSERSEGRAKHRDLETDPHLSLCRCFPHSHCRCHPVPSPSPPVNRCQANVFNGATPNVTTRTYVKGGTLGHAHCIEQDGIATVTLVRTAGTSGAVSVQHRSFVDNGDTATAGADFQSSVGSVFFADGQSSAVRLSGNERRIEARCGREKGVEG